MSSVERGGEPIGETAVEPMLESRRSVAAAVKQNKRNQRNQRRGKARGLPGEGPTFGLSVISVLAIASLWWAATALRWVPPLFLPSPQAVWAAFIDAWHGRIQGGLPLTLLCQAAAVESARSARMSGYSSRTI
jgi:hypothetical protein